jgi:hypothetical protein
MAQTGMAQTGAAPAIKAPGDKVTLEISANSQPGRAPVILKWDVIFPVQLMLVESDPEPSTAAAKAGKSLQCLAQKPYSYDCELSGGRNPIPDGVVAVFHFRIRKLAVAGPATFRIEKVRAIAADTRETSLSDTQAGVVVKLADPAK